MKEPIDFEKPHKRTWAEKKKFLLQTKNFRIPVTLIYHRKLHLLEDDRLMKNFFLMKLEITKNFPFEFISNNKDKFSGL